MASSIVLKGLPSIIGRALDIQRKRSVYRRSARYRSHVAAVDFCLNLPANSIAEGYSMTSTLDQTEFRDALSRFASGVTIVLTRNGSGAFVGFTASAFSSVSLEPPLVLVCLQKVADSYPAFMDTDAF